MKIPLAIALLGFSSALVATDATWTLNNNGNWNVNGNWTPATFPNAIGDIARFLNAITANRTVTLGQNITIGTIFFDDNNNYNITGNTLTFSNGGTANINITNINGNGAHSIASAMSLTDTVNITHSTTSTFTLSGAISGAGGITKNGTGTGALILSNVANSYLGATNINEGFVTYLNNGAIPTASSVTVGDGVAPNATLTIAANMTAPNALKMTVNSDGTLVQNSNITVFVTSLQGSGAINLSNGTSSSSLFDIGGSIDTTFTGSITGGSSSISSANNSGNRVIKDGTATITLTGSASNYISRTFIANGVIDVQNGGALGASGNGSAVYVQGGATAGSLYLENNISLAKDLFLNGNGFTSTGALRNVSGNNTVTGNVTIGWAGGTQVASSVTAQVDTGTTLTLSGALQGSSALTKTNPGTLTYSGTLANTLSGLTTINDGTIFLNKTAGVNAIAGNVLINGGILSLGAANQIINTSTVTQSSGTFNLGGFSDTIGSYVFNGGTYTPGGGILSLTNAVTALSMRDTTISGDLSITAAGAVVFDSTNNGTATISGNINLGTTTSSFNIANGTAATDMLVSGVISSTGAGLTKISAGLLELSGALPNTYSGLTTVTSGTLLLNKTAGVSAVPGNVLINGGTLSLAASDQIATTSTVTQSSGTFDLGGFSDTIGTYVFNGGTYTPGAGTLSLTNAVTALSMRNTTISGNLGITGGGAVVFDATSNGTATISGNVDLGTITPNFNVANGTATTDMLVSGVISSTGAGLTKIGSGLLEFSGALPNTYLGLTTVTAGTLRLNKTSGINAISDGVLINGGTLSLAAADQMADSSTVTLSSGTFGLGGFSETIGTFIYNAGTFTPAGATLTLANASTALSMRNTTISSPLSITNGGAIVFDPTNNGTATISGSLNLGTLTPNFDIGNGTSANDMSISGVISSSGAGITKIGSGTLVLSNVANSYLGATNINEGSITYLNNGAIPTASSVTVGDGVAPNATLTIAANMTAPNALKMTVNSDGNLIQNSNITVFVTSLQGSGAINLSNGTANTCIFDIGGSVDTTFAGSITGGSSSVSAANNAGNRVIKEGTATTTLTGAASNYISRTFIANGVIDVQNGGALGASGNGSAVYVQGGATAGSLYLENNISLAKDLFLNGNGFTSTGALRNVSGDNTVTGNVTIGWAGGTQVASSVTAQVDTGTTLTLSGALQGSSALTKTNPGTLTYSGTLANTLSGLTTINDGTIFLNKPTGVNAIAGNVLINGGMLSLGAANQIINTSTVTQSSGTFDLGGFSETIGTYIFNGGTFTPGAGTLSLANAVTALSMRDTTITGDLSIAGAGAVVFDSTNNGTATISGNINLGTTTPSFNIANGTAATDMLVSGVISSTGAGLTKISTGLLEFSGALPNTYSGLTTVTAGTLLLNKTAGINAVPGNVLINGGTLSLAASDQIANTSTVTQSSGTFDLGGFSDTIGTYVFNGGTYTPSGGTLSLTNAVTSLSMRNTTLSGNLEITAGGAVVFDATNNGTATISGNVDLGAITPNFNVANGTATTDMLVSGVISSTGAGLTKIGTGLLELSGALPNTYSGLTTVTAGTLLLNKTSGVNAIPDGVLINGGTLLLGASEEISDSSTLTLSTGTFNMASFPETIGTFVYNGGTFTPVGATLTLANSGTALSMRNTTISSPLSITNGGAVVFDATNNGTATISGNLNLGTITPNFDIADGTSATDMLVSGVISSPSAGAGLTKIGSGVLRFSGASPNTYSGLTTVTAGTLQLNKTAGVDAIPGDVLINGGILSLVTANQIANTSTVTLSSGTFNLTGLSETIGTFVFNGGTFTPGGATLTLANAGTALSMRDTTISSSIAITAGGSVVFDATNDGTATISGNLNLGTITPNFDIADGTAATDMLASGVISSSGAGLTKIGAGLLEFSGASPNTYSGLTTVSAGTLLLNKTAGVNAILGDVLINGGALTIGAPEQISNNSTVTLSTGTFNMPSAETIETFNFEGGTFTQGATLSLIGPIDALSMRNTTINGAINILGGGAIIFDPTNNGTATINGDIDLGGLTSIFNIADGSSFVDMNITSIINNGGINKTGAGLLQLLGANTYTNGTTITAGTLQGNTTSLQGNIIDNANLIFEQSSDGTFNGTLSGTGTMLKKGMAMLTFSNANTLDGLTTVDQGTLSINGTYGGAGLLLVNPSGRLQGTGTISKNSTIFGTLAAGNSVGTLHFVGSQVLATGSTLEVEVNPATIDLIDITGDLTIQNGSSLHLIPAAAIYPDDFIYQIIGTTGGVTGTFSSVTSTLPLFQPLVVYTPNDVFLKGSFLPFISIFNKGNAEQVAKCLDSMSLTGECDIRNIILQLQFLPTVEDLTEAILQFQPSAFTSLAIAQEDSMLYVKNTIFDHSHLRPCNNSSLQNCNNLWIFPFMGFTKQNSSHQEPGFRANTYGFFAGLDHSFSEEFMVGTGVGYGYTKFNWKMNRGKAKTHNLYGSLYSTYERGNGFIQAAIIGGYSKYHIDRHIEFGSSFFQGETVIDRHAKSNHHGLEASLNAYGALDYSYSQLNISPFIDLDFLFLHENSFKESGANSLDLHVKSKNSTLLSSQLGIDFSNCTCISNTLITKTLQIGVIRESRFSGGKEVASFSCNNCTMKVKGLSPSRTLGSLKIGILADSLACFYNGRYGSGFHDHSLSVEIIF